jgi:ammonium transporter, Amt family
LGTCGFLSICGFCDFAGLTVVNTIGGIASLAVTIVVDPQIEGVFKRDGGEMPPLLTIKL